ncbi:hypothetical protein ACPEEZ_14860 [Frigoribacterium sp. 2-23]|uniref:hypothetical protein n=1 Tax=Frigoribacterium sp. 2-23 TaxID=3415006 RepID=UPI003C6FB818
MTLLAPVPTTSIRLAEAEAGFWVANHDGAFAGTIDRHGDHYYVRDCFGQYVGDYSSQAAAAERLRMARGGA